MSGVQCKKCRYLLKDKEGYNWCPNKTDDPDIDLIRDCEWYAVKTNADRIRSMTNEELANMWYSYVDCGACPMHRECNILPKDCLRLALEWLKSESEDASEDN